MNFNCRGDNQELTYYYSVTINININFVVLYEPSGFFYVLIIKKLNY